jgi:hypothetical protein
MWRRRHPIRAVEEEVEHLRKIEEEGESAETPAIAIGGIFLFLLPIALLFTGIAFAAYYLTS